MSIEIEKGHAGYILRVCPQRSLNVTAQDLRDIYEWCLRNMRELEQEAEADQEYEDERKYIEHHYLGGE